MDHPSACLIGEMSIMNRSGHEQLTWRGVNPEEIAKAREIFDHLVGNGYSGFASKTKTDAKHLIGSFDPTMEDVVMVPSNVGG